MTSRALTPEQTSFADLLFTKSKLDTKQIAELMDVPEREIWNARAAKDNIVDLASRRKSGA